MISCDFDIIGKKKKKKKLLRHQSSTPVKLNWLKAKL